MPAANKKQVEFDPKMEILEKVGDVSGYEIAHNELLLAIYMRPEKTAGGIVLPQQNLREDLFQAKAHLVLKIGPGCTFKNLKIGVHDWVVVRPSDAWSLDLNMNPDMAMDVQKFSPCRMVYDDQIRAKISDPRMVW